MADTLCATGEGNSVVMQCHPLASSTSFISSMIRASMEIEAPTASIDPKFKDGVVVRAGETFVIDAEIFGTPLPRVKWLKDGKEIDMTTPRMEVVKTFEHTVLTVKDCIRVDSGQFVLSLSNVAGKKDMPVNVKVLDRPGPPDGPVRITGVTAEKVTLHWSHPLHDGGASVLHYILEKRVTNRVSWTVVEPEIQAVSYKVTKLVPGTEYVFRVKAVNKFGMGEPLESEPVTACCPFKPPSCPSKPEASAITSDSMVLTWKRPEDDGGSEIDGYIMEKRDKEGIRWTKCNKRRLTDTRFRCTGLTEGHSYEFRVSAENSAGVGVPSEPTGYIKACDPIYPPGPPYNPRVTDHSTTSVSLAWTKPIHDCGAPITGYAVEVKEAAEEEWKTCTPPTGVEETHFTVKKLKENEQYNFRIRAINAEGAGEPSDIPGNVVTSERLEAPEIELDSDLRKVVSVRACATLRLFVTIRGRPEPEVKWSKVDGPLSEHAEIEVTSSYTVLVINSVNRFDTGKYLLTLENISGTKSAFINVRVLDSPSAPESLEVNDITRNSVSLCWKPPLIVGGVKITHYIVEKREAQRRVFTTVSDDCVKNRMRIDNLIEGGLYYFRVLAVNELGVGLPAETQDPVKVCQAPLPPRKVTVVDVTRNSVSLSWEKPDDDGGSRIKCYIVEMQTKRKDSWTVCNEIRGLQATIDGLSMEDEYSFRISAVNETGKSEPNVLAEYVVVKDVTMKPIIDLISSTFSVKAGDDLKIDVPFRGRPEPEATWTKDGIELKEKTRVNILTSKSSSKLTIRNTAMEDSGNYEICVTNAVGKTSAIIAVVILDKPGPIGAIRIDEVSADYISLSWEPPLNGGGCQISNYVVEKRDTTSATWKTVSATVARTSFKVPRLTQGTEYQFRIAAENRYGKSHAVESDLVVAQYPFKTPGPPTALHVAKATKSFMMVAWKEPVSDGGSPVIGYHLEMKDYSGIRWTKINRQIISATDFKVTRIEEKLLYEFRVSAENLAGIGAYSNVTEPVAARDPCDPPVNLTVTDITRSSVSLSWSKPENDGGAKVTGYIVECRELPDGCWLKCNFNNLLETCFEIMDLTEDVQYDFHVIAKNSAGVLSEPSLSTGAVTVKDNVVLPRIVVDDKFKKCVVVKAGDTLRIDADISGCPRPVITWSKDNDGIMAKGRVEITSTHSITTLIVRDTIRSDSGQYIVSLQNVAGTKSLSVKCKILDRPGPSTGPLEVTGLTAEKCTLNWEPPQENSGAEIAHYIVEKCETSRVNWTLVYENLKATTCKVASLRKGSEYIFRVRAVNEYGEGEALESEPIEARDPFTVPAAPTDVEVSNITSEAMTICWKRPETDGGSSISGYVIEKREKSEMRWVRVNKKPVYDLRFKATNLSEGCEYEYRVYAENSAGLSLPSIPCNLTKAVDPQFLPSPPAKPKIIDSTKTSVTLSWNKPLFDGGATVTGYCVEYKRTDFEDWSVGIYNTEKTEFTVVGLRPGAEYVFVVKAINKIGVSEPSPPSDPQVAEDREEKPEFNISNDLRKTILVKSGSSFNLTVPFKGKPIPNVTWDKADTDLRVRASIYTTDTFTSITVEEATRDDSGKYTVTLQNVAGKVAFTLNVRVLDSPGPPCCVSVKDVMKTSATVTWDTPENEGGAAVTNYHVDIREVNNKGWTRLTDRCPRLTYKVSDLQEGAVYYFRVIGENDYGVGIPAETKDGIKMTDSKLWAEAVVVKDDTVKPIIDLISKNFIIKAGDVLTINVPFKSRPQPEASWKKYGTELNDTRVNILTSNNSSKLTIRNTTTDDSGNYEISLTNAVGKTSAIIAVVILDRPGPIGAIRIDEVSADSISLSWEPPLHDGGCQISNYVVEKRDTTSATWKTVSATVARTSFKVPRLTQGTEYQFRIVAENRYGKSHAVESDLVVAQYPFKTPGPPTALHVAKAAKSFMMLAWKEPASDGGSPIIGYYLEMKNHSSICWTKINRLPITETEFKLTRIEESLLYEFRISAENLAGIGAYSNVTEPVAARDPCDPPVNLTVTDITRSSVSLSWSKPENDGGAKVTGYIVECRELPDGCWLKCNFNNLLETCFEIMDLTEDVQYDFHVIAKNSAGVLSEPSLSTGAVTAKDNVVLPRIVVDDKFKKCVVVKAGDILRIEANISGRPRPVITWSKDNKSIMAKGRVEITSTHSITTLIVRDTIRSDSGQYIVSLQNVAGTKSLSVKCKILDRPGPSTGPLEVTGLTAEKCTLNWEPPQENGGAEVTHYIVEKCETSRVNWTLVYEQVKATTCKVASLRKGSEYIFRVRAVNEYGEGEALESEPIEARDPFTIPAAPTDVEVSNITSETMTICWKRPETDGGSSISGYVIEKREKSEMRWVRVNKKPVYDLRFKATNLSEGCEYEYRVYADNSAGLSLPSIPCKLTKAENTQFLPSPPAKPKVIDSTKTSITLSWNKPLFDGGATVTGYCVEYKRTDFEDWSVGIYNTEKTEFTVVGLRPGAEYVFVVKAINKTGVSDPSPPSDPQVAEDREEKPEFDISNDLRKTILVKSGSSFNLTVPFKGKPIPNVTWDKADTDLRVRASIHTTDTFTSITVEEATRDDSGKYTVTLQNVAGKVAFTLNIRVLDSPGPPCRVAVKEVTKTSATVTWDTPENEGGAAVTNYHVDIREVSNKGWTRVTDRCPRLTYKVSDLHEGGVYYFRVTAENEYGVGIPAETKYGTMITEKPSPPTKFLVTETTNESVSLAWGKPECDGGSRITCYRVDALEKGQDKWVKVGVTKTVHFVVNDLKEATEYFFRVRAENHAGFSDPTEMSHPVLVKGQLEPPEINMNKFPNNTVSVRAGSNLKCEIQLTGKPAPKVSLSKDDVVLKSTTRLNYFLVPGGLIIDLHESTATDAGRYDICASNSSGASRSFVNIVVLDRPSAPLGPVEISDVTEDSLSLTWHPPHYDGGSPITNYIILKRETTSADWTEVSSSVVKCTIKIMKLKTGLEYQFRIRAENRYGISEYVDSATVRVDLDYSVPDAPSAPVVTSVSRESITVSWVEPVSNGGRPIVGYHLQMKDKNSILWQTVNKSVIRAAHFKVQNINAGLIYEFKVAAENAAGCGPLSSASDAVLAIDACEPPTNVRITHIRKTSIRLEWLKPNYDGGSKITGYLIEMKEDEKDKWTKANLTNVSDTHYTVEDLNECEVYEFRVRAKNAAGSVSNPSNTAGPVMCVDTEASDED
ncbi:titin [Esox lucius]|uniref:titin n=1 Tax=Esox lucius TaxID=8010 RepID=UPI0014772154|nr:titin [Esox lucius]